MIQGQTFRSACEAGTLFQISNETNIRHGVRFAGAKNPQEAADLLILPPSGIATYWIWYPPGMLFTVRRVLDSTIGCTVVGAEVWHFRFDCWQMIPCDQSGANLHPKCKFCGWVKFPVDQYGYCSMCNEAMARNND